MLDAGLIHPSSFIFPLSSFLFVYFHCARCNPERRPLITHTLTTTTTAIAITDTVNAVAPPQLKSLTSWKIVIVATVVPGVNKKMMTESVVTARTDAGAKPVGVEPSITQFALSVGKVKYHTAEPSHKIFP